MPIIKLCLPDSASQWIDAQLRSGRFRNADDYVLALIRRDQERQRAIEEIQDLVTEGTSSGEPEVFDVESFLHRKRAEYTGRGDR